MVVCLGLYRLLGMCVAAQVFDVCLESTHMSWHMSTRTSMNATERQSSLPRSPFLIVGNNHDTGVDRIRKLQVHSRNSSAQGRSRTHQATRRKIVRLACEDHASRTYPKDATDFRAHSATLVAFARAWFHSTTIVRTPARISTQCACGHRHSSL